MFTFLGLATMVLFFAGVAFGCFANGEGLGLERYDLLENWLAMVCLSSMYSLILLLRDGKGLTSDPHGLYFDIWVV